MPEQAQLVPSRRERYARAAGRLALAALYLYAVFLGLYLLWRLLWGSGFWPVALANTFAHWLLLPALPLLVILAALRRWPLAAVYAAAAALWLIWYGGLFVPRVAAAAEGELTLRVMTFNAYTADEARFIPTLAGSEADIIGVQELQVWQAAGIEAELAAAYPYRALYGEDGVTGSGLLSRYPVLAHERLEQFGMPGIFATVAVDGAPLTVIVAHPPPPSFSLRGYRVNPSFMVELAAYRDMATGNGPAVMLGDFNMSDQADGYGMLAAAGLVDAHRAAGWGFGVTWPAHRAGYSTPPLVRIDYVWHTPHLRTLASWVGPDAGSDHLPVLADLAWAAG